MTTSESSCVYRFDMAFGSQSFNAHGCVTVLLDD